jgi:hypothetical protein
MPLLQKLQGTEVKADRPTFAEEGFWVFFGINFLIFKYFIPVYGDSSNKGKSPLGGGAGGGLWNFPSLESGGLLGGLSTAGLAQRRAANLPKLGELSSGFSASDSDGLTSSTDIPTHVGSPFFYF